MVAIVIVSHSATLARGAAELAREMGGADVVIAEAGGLDLPGEPLGTDAQRVAAAIEEAMSPDGVLVLMDLGSAVLSAELALDLLPPDLRDRVRLCPAPLVEGAVSAATAARLGLSLAEVAAEAQGALAPKAAQLGEVGPEEAAPPVTVEAGAGHDVHDLRLVLKNRLGLHARPAARLVRTVAAFDAEVELTNVTSGRGPGNARSLNAVAALGARQGDEVLVTARGPQAAATLAAVRQLAEHDFGDEEPAAVRPPESQPAGASGRAPPGTLVGVAASSGAAVGPVRRVRPATPGVPADGARGDRQAESQALQRALEAARQEIAAMRKSVARRVGEYEAAIFDAHLLLLEDEALLGPAQRAIDEGGSAARAWDGAVRVAADALAGLDDPYQRARADDVADVGRRVLAYLTVGPGAAVTVDGPGILVAADLAPSDAAALDKAGLLGVATAAGGPLGHGAILARSLGIPAVVGLGEDVLALPEGTLVVVDGGEGLVLVDPEPAVAAAYRERSSASVPVEEEPVAEGPVRTRDGRAIAVAANAASVEDSRHAARSGADGIGLLRTEFLFLDRRDLPSEDEQVAAYREVAEALGGRPLVVRTLDAGSDKPLPGLPTGMAAGEANPALGVRGLRLGLAYPDVLAAQLRSIVRAGATHPLQVMFPMVTTADEVRRAKELLAEARRAVEAAGHAVSQDLPVGVMVEVPAAALAARPLAREVDFFSIGTNDLTQYVMAADRTNPAVAPLSDGLHPAVLRLIRFVTEAAAEAGCRVAVCGELAADPQAIPVLVGLGVTELSVRPGAVAATRAAVKAIDASSADALGRRAEAAPSAAAVRELVSEPAVREPNGRDGAGRLVTRLTWARIAFVPVIMALVLAGDDTRYAYVAAAVVFAVAAFTDLLDGYLARRWSQTSVYGSFLDTTADKVLVAGALVALVSVGRASAWWAGIIVVREIAVLALRALVASSGRLVPPSVWGKLKANVEFGAIALAIFRPPWRLGGWYADEWAMAAAALLAVVSAAEYFSRFATSTGVRAQ